MFFLGNPTTPRKSKQHFKFWPVFEWFSQEIQLGFANRSKLFNFDPFLNGFCKKSYQTSQVGKTFSILIRFWMVFPRNPTRLRKSKQTFQFWPVFEWFLSEIVPARPRKSKQLFQFWPGFQWFLQEILLDHENRSNLSNFDPFLNGFCKKSNQASQIEANFWILTRFWKAFAGNPTRPRKSK